MAHDTEQAIRERAYALWEKEGSPEGRDAEFWERARLIVEAERRPVSTMVGDRSEEEREQDEALEATFPASDPPSETQAKPARKSTRKKK